MFKVINTKKDLDAIKGTPQYETFMAFLDGGQTKRINKAVFPEKYDRALTPQDEGYIADEWEEVEDAKSLSALGLSKKDVSDRKKELEPKIGKG